MFQDLRYGVRMLLKKPGFSLVAILTLALGVGANTAIFSVTDKLLLRSLAVRSPEQLVLLTSVSVKPHFVSNVFSYPNFVDYRKQNQVFSDIVAFNRSEFELQTSDRPERISGEYVSGNYFEMLGLRPAEGRAFSTDESSVAQPVAVVSEAFSRGRFGTGNNAVGKVITINGLPLTIIGVMPRSFTGIVIEQPTSIWVPVLMHPQLAQSKFIEPLQLLARIKPGVTFAQAEAGMDLLAQQVKDANTPAGVIRKGLPFSEQHIRFEPGGKGISFLRKKFASPLKLLMAVVGLVLFIACANVAGLLLARGISRRKEMAIRLSLGANSWRVARQLLIESLLLASAGGIAGLLLAPWLVALLTKSQSQLDIASTLLGQTLDLRVLVFSAITTLLAGVVFGVAPALQSSKAELVPMLKDDGGGFSQRERRLNFRSLLVVAQLALALVVLIGAGLCVRSLRNLIAIDPGFQTENVLVVPLELEDKKYDDDRGEAFQQQVFERLEKVPGVTSLSYGSVMPFSGSRFMSSLFVEGRQPLPNEQMAFDASVVGPRFHETMGIKLTAGRGFTEQDRKGSTGVIIINETLARQLFPGENALGKRLMPNTKGPGLEVVGISSDVKHHELTEAAIPHFDLPAKQRGYEAYTNIVVRANGKAADLIPTIRNELLSLDPSLSVKDISPMSAQIGDTLAATRLASTLIGIFGFIALLLAAIGLYGVIAWMVAQRTREVGIRMALGAQRGDVLRLILRQGLWLTLMGVTIGLIAAFASTRLIDTQQLYEVSATDPWTFAFIALLLTLVSLLATYLPARRATKVDPLVALRYE